MALNRLFFEEPGRDAQLLGHGVSTASSLLGSGEHAIEKDVHSKKNDWLVLCPKTTKKEMVVPQIESRLVGRRLSKSSCVRVELLPFSLCFNLTSLAPQATLGP